MVLLADHQSNRNTAVTIVSGVTGPSGLPENWLPFRRPLATVDLAGFKEFIVCVNVHSEILLCSVTVKRCFDEILSAMKSKIWDTF